MATLSLDSATANRNVTGFTVYEIDFTIPGGGTHHLNDATRPFLFSDTLESTSLSGFLSRLALHFLLLPPGSSFSGHITHGSGICISLSPDTLTLAGV